MKMTFKKTADVLTIFMIMGICLTAFRAIADDADNTFDSTANIEFVAGTGPVGPVDPTEPAETISPDPGPNPAPPGTGNTGALTIDFASNLYFGSHTVNDKVAKAHAQSILLTAGDESSLDHAHTRPNYVQVSDLRGTFAGWALNMTMSEAQSIDASVAPTDQAGRISGLQLTFTGGYVASENYEPADGSAVDPAAPTGALGAGATTTIVEPNVTLPVFSAAAGNGVGTWLYGFGAGMSGASNASLIQNNNAYQEQGGAPLDYSAISNTSPITMTIPAGFDPRAIAYQSVLTWSLSDIPGNTA